MTKKSNEDKTDKKQTKAGTVELTEEELDQVPGGLELIMQKVIVTSLAVSGSKSGSSSGAKRIKK